MDTDKPRKALAVIAGSYRLMQAIWFALAYPEYEWSVVLLRYGENTDNIKEMERHCLRFGCFKNVFIVITTSRFSGLLDKVIDFSKMFFSYILGNRKKYCRQYIESYIGTFDYDLLCLASSYSLFEGAVLNFSDEIQTIMMQEGMDDYVESYIKSDIFTKIAGQLLYRMKYVNFLGLRHYPHNENCEKYATSPDKIIETNYLKKSLLFDENKVHLEKYENLLKKVYDVYDDFDYDVVVFTCAESFSRKRNEDKNKLRTYLCDNFKDKKILIKKHPQDIYEYDWVGLNIQCKYLAVPGEVIIKLASKAKFIFEFPTTILLSVVYDGKYDYVLIHYCMEMIDSYEHDFKDGVDFFQLSESNIVKVK